MTQPPHTDHNQPQFSQSDDWSQRVLELFLVFIETLLTLTLRFDTQLRQAVYPLAQAQVVIKIRTYLPNQQFYLSFTNKGILLDNDLPLQKTQADILLNAYSFEIILAILSDKKAKIDALQYIGDEQKIQWFKHFLQTLSVNHLLNRLLSVFGKNKTDNQEEKQNSKQEKVEHYKEQINQLEISNNQLMTDNARLSTQVAQLKSRQSFYHYLSIAFAVIAVIALVVMVIRW